MNRRIEFLALEIKSLQPGTLADQNLRMRLVKVAQLGREPVHRKGRQDREVDAFTRSRRFNLQAGPGQIAEDRAGRLRIGLARAGQAQAFSVAHQQRNPKLPLK
ncbi:MAG: hypothetical protein P8X66_09790, partial [Maritimibacter sp.]